MLTRNLWQGRYPTFDKWALMDTPYPMIAIFLAYLVFVLKIGPRYMENRKPYKLNNITRAYNLFQVVSCSLIVFCIPAVRNSLHPWKCVPRVTSEADIKFIHDNFWICWYVLMLRTLEFVETVFFVLRKKQSQVSALHVYHHVAVSAILWLFIKYSAEFQEIFVIGLNSAVHIIMYMYYFLSSFESLRPLTFKAKPFITAMQIIQLVAICTHCVFSLSFCDVSKLYWLQVANIVILITMFVKFYMKEYVSDKGRKEKPLNGYVKESIKAE